MRNSSYVIKSRRSACSPVGPRRIGFRAEVSGVTAVNGLWYLADQAEQSAERAYHRVTERYGQECIQRTHRKNVHRDRFRTLASRIQRNGTPYGVHTLVRRDSGELLLVRHEGVDLWVLPGGGVDGAESFRETAERELDEEAGVEATYRGLAMLNRVEIGCRGCETWGVLPVFHAVAETTEPKISDPDGEISAARWFEPNRLPEDTRDRDDLIRAARAVT